MILAMPLMFIGVYVGGYKWVVNRRNHIGFRNYLSPLSPPARLCNESRIRSTRYVCMHASRERAHIKATHSFYCRYYCIIVLYING